MYDERQMNEITETLRYALESMEEAQKMIYSSGVLHGEEIDWDNYDKILSGMCRTRFVIQNVVDKGKKPRKPLFG